MPKMRTHEQFHGEEEPEAPLSPKKKHSHVSKACSNCQKGHLACDAQRPCSRCLKSGKESSCVDVEQRKRGWRKGRARTGNSSVKQEDEHPGSSSSPSPPAFRTTPDSPLFEQKPQNVPVFSYKHPFAQDSLHTPPTSVAPKIESGYTSPLDLARSSYPLNPSSPLSLSLSNSSPPNGHGGSPFGMDGPGFPLSLPGRASPATFQGSQGDAGLPEIPSLYRPPENELKNLTIQQEEAFPNFEELNFDPFIISNQASSSPISTTEELRRYPDGFILELSLGGVILDCRGTALADMGYNREDLIGQNLFGFLFPGDVDVIQKVMHVAMEVPNLTSFNLLFRFAKRGQQEYVWIECRVQIETTEKHASTILKLTGNPCDANYEYSGNVASEPPEKFGAFTLKSFPDGRCVEVTDGILFSLGYKKSDVKGKWMMDFIHPQDLEVANSAQGRIVAERGSSCTLRMRMKTKNGKYIWMQSFARTIKNPITKDVEWMMCHFQPVRKKDIPIAQSSSLVCSQNNTSLLTENFPSDPNQSDLERLRQENLKLIKENQSLRLLELENETLRLQLKTLQQKVIDKNVEGFDDVTMNDVPLDSYHSMVSRFGF